MRRQVMYPNARTAALVARLALSAAAPAAAATLRGKITQVDLKAKTFTVENGKKSTRFTLAEDVKVMNDGTASDVAELAKGERVKVDYTVDHDKQLASRVDIQPDATRKKAPAPGKSPAPGH